MKFHEFSVRPTLGEWEESLAEPLRHAFGKIAQGYRISLLCGPKPVADDTTKLLVSNQEGRPVGVFLCSAFAAPDMVARNIHRSRQAQQLLGPELGEAVLAPLVEGEALGLTYALLPYCHPLSESRLIGRAHRALLTHSLLGWLRRATIATVRPAETDGRVHAETVAALEHLTQFSGMDDLVRAVAHRALDRLAAGLWTPRRVLMHGDFWCGNVLIRPRGLAGAASGRWQDRFTIIDWAGSRTDGFAFFDLVKLAQSVRLSRRKLAIELDAHSEILGCDPSDAASYLASALGYIGLNLEHFPPHRFITMAVECLGTLEGLEIPSGLKRLKPSTGMEEELSHYLEEEEESDWQPSYASSFSEEPDYWT